MARRTRVYKRPRWWRWLIFIAAGLLVSGVWKGFIQEPPKPPPPSNVIWSIPVPHAPGAAYPCPTSTVPDRFGGCGPAPLPTASPGQHRIVLYYDTHCRSGTSSTGQHLQADQWTPDASGHYVKLPQSITLTKCQGVISG